ncbi:MAG: ATP-binding protein [Treponema sp.]|nr:ATP-binding protein [Treponema sp.]
MTIFKKSFLTLGVFVFGFSAIFVISVFVFMNSLYYEINMISLKNTARLLLNSIGNENITEIFNSSEDDQYNINNILPFNSDGAYRLTLIAPSGYVLWDSHVTDRMVNHIDREEVIAALEGREGESRRDSISTGIKRIYFALPVFENTNVIGVFRLSISIPEFGTRVSPVFIPFIIFICLFLTIALFAIFMFSRSLSVSLGRLVKIVRTSTPLLTSPDVENIALEFSSLEKALRIMKDELNLRFEQAKAEGNRLEAILNGMSEAVFAMDSNLKLLLVNPRARELFCLGDNNVNASGENEMTLLEATRSTELLEIAKKALDNKSGIPLETELTFHSGTEKNFLVNASSLEDINNVKSGVVLVLQDVTRLIKLERIRKDFVANVSHELRTPIQLIKGFSETLLEPQSEENASQVKHFIEIIYKNAKIMENLTNDLLILSSLENNTISVIDMDEVNIISIINEAVSSLEPLVNRKQIEIIINCEENLKVRLYSSLIIQALKNLIDNGIKYSQVKSKLWINASLGGESANNELIIEVQDKGIGISGEHINRIFERFYRVDRARSKEDDAVSGTGLGLSIVRHIALLHKGNAEAESRLGQGSIFRIKIPC